MLAPAAASAAARTDSARDELQQPALDGCEDGAERVAAAEDLAGFADQRPRPGARWRFSIRYSGRSAVRRKAQKAAAPGSNAIA